MGSTIKLCIFDMGGVLIRNHNVSKPLLEYLGRKESSFRELGPEVMASLRSHSRGELGERELWNVYRREIDGNLEIPGESLLGRFFLPVMDVPTLNLVEELKRSGMRVVCGTNVIDSHYRIHVSNGDYDVFDKVYPSHIMKTAKPEPGFFSYITETENVRPEEAFFTDDLEENVEAAARAGLNSFLYKNAGELRIRLAELGLLPGDGTDNAGSGC